MRWQQEPKGSSRMSKAWSSIQQGASHIQHTVQGLHWVKKSKGSSSKRRIYTSSFNEELRPAQQPSRSRGCVQQSESFVQHAQQQHLERAHGELILEQLWCAHEIRSVTT
ncbi:hypothetical protein VIGAN_01249000 [Vigna angularis var. angularis]|uniref:Uncharacterized protein n=1 Tax=Vigna angularis var. angularis TaxID=157739 RepID=A0A0S3R2K1_PHAAN|nr:hypothetical protein VIGAN_01249000 [Vigna angularis var. angularis]